MVRRLLRVQADTPGAAGYREEKEHQGDQEDSTQGEARVRRGIRCGAEDTGDITLLEYGKQENVMHESLRGKKGQQAQKTAYETHLRMLRYSKHEHEMDKSLRGKKDPKAQKTAYETHLCMGLYSKHEHEMDESLRGKKRPKAQQTA